MHAQAVYANAMPAFMRLLAHGMLVGFLLLQAASARAEETPAIIGSTTPLEQATDFKAQPLAILSKFPEAGTAMARFVAQAVMRDPGALDAILSVMDIASPEQASAMGAGMVRAVRAMEARQSRNARLIAAKVMRTANVWLKTTFLAIGPAYAADAPLILPEPVAPALLSSTPTGTSLLDGQSKLGPDYKRINTSDSLKNTLDIADNSRDPGAFNENGTIVALIADGPLVSTVASTASNNGGTPTSP
jgi:hypothetical protein